MADESNPTDGTIEDLKAHVASVDDVDELEALRHAENAGKDRAGAHAVIDARIAALTPTQDDEADEKPKTLEDRVAAIEKALALGDPTLIAARFG